MGEPCGQGERFGRIEATLQFFQEAEKRRELREERIAASMETMAAHSATIEAHAATLTRHDKAFENLFRRVNTLEVEPLRKKGFVIRILESKAGLYILAAVFLGFAIDCTVNYPLVKKFIDILK